MEYLIVIIFLGVLFAGLFIREMIWAQKQKRQFIKSLQEQFGKPPFKKMTLEKSLHIPGYFVRHKEKGQIDDITWNDLGMDEVFRRMNYTYSATGEEYLYYLLRSAGQSRKRAEHFEELVLWFAEHEKERLRFLELMSRLGNTGKYSLYDYIENLDALGERRNGKEYMWNGLYIPLICLLYFQFAPALSCICFLSVYRIISYFKEKAKIEPYIVSFAYVTRLIRAGEEFAKEKFSACAEENQQVKECLLSLKKIRKGFFCIAPASGMNTSGNPLEILMDYGRMMFHADLIVFNNMLRKLRKHQTQLDILISTLGLLEAAVSVGYFRASLTNGWCVPKLSEETEELVIEEGYHPLLMQPVKNSIHASKGVLLTGSNASGKSTFLKMVAINGIMAQTIHTCTAKTYRSLVRHIYSSMSLRDDLKSGESYYIVELKALKRILDASKQGEKILCFVDEVLRGTNTVERIAASAQILKGLGEEVICFAATHDIELTGLLEKEYDNYHFEEEIREGDIVFPYRLMQGKATTQNAIKLLSIMGYSPEITQRAQRRAELFLETGTWQA